MSLFNWFQPDCPVEPDAKAWIEERLRWLTQQFGIKRLREGPVILPTDSFFPDPYDGSEKAAGRLFERLCVYMGIDAQSLQLRFKSLPRHPGSLGPQSWNGASGLYQDGMITIDFSVLPDPMILTATLAHELGHVLLLGEGRITDEVEDHEPLTDLLVLFLGVGVFTANANVRDATGHFGHWEYWSINRQGYLNQRQIAYALALIALARGEEKPLWAKHLCLDVRTYLKQGLHYLLKTRDTEFDPG